MVVPGPLAAPVMVTVEYVQLKLLGTEAVNTIFGSVPLQILADAKLVTSGLGWTVTVIVLEMPVHEPNTVAVGVTIYCTVPVVRLLGLVNIWAIVAPEPALAPVILPVIVPIVHVKLLLLIEAVKLIFVLVPLHMAAELDVVTIGAGLTVTVIVFDTPVHEPVVAIGVTIYSTVPAAVLIGLVKV